MEPSNPKLSKDSPISFQHLTEGLGFHPFSDGLPYAPIAKNPRAQSGKEKVVTGTGAVAAGPPRIGPLPQGSRDHIVPQISVPVVKKDPEAEKKSQDENQKKTSAPLWIPSYSYLFKRMMAYIFDVFINLILCGLIGSSFIWGQEYNPEIFSNIDVLVSALFVFLVVHWVLMTTQEVIFKTTLGKKMFRLGLYGNRTLILIRALFFCPSVGFFGLGIFWSLFESRKYCWHDRMTGISPVELA